ncbi:hypothetical protein BX666DRAFT_2028700 [Dichotomocladium elegans]|nr:hypothetical protein BX666DRAFT_2028700 [Dichotomocladium elegans]
MKVQLLSLGLLVSSVLAQLQPSESTSSILDASASDASITGAVATQKDESTSSADAVGSSYTLETPTGTASDAATASPTAPLEAVTSMPDINWWTSLVSDTSAYPTVPAQSAATAEPSGTHAASSDVVISPASSMFAPPPAVASTGYTSTGKTSASSPIPVVTPSSKASMPATAGANKPVAADSAMGIAVAVVVAGITLL